jgi:polysaccharide biosynthesis transport protein
MRNLDATVASIKRDSECAKNLWIGSMELNDRAPAGDITGRPVQLGFDPSEIGSNQTMESVARTPWLTQYLRIALRWKWVIAGAIAFALVTSLIITLLMTPHYTAVSIIEIAREQDKIVKVEGVEQESNSANLEFYQTQYGLLQASSLAQRVAIDLRLVDNEKFFDLFGVVPDGANTVAANGVLGPNGRDKRVLQAGEILLNNIDVSPVRGSSLVEIRFTSPDRKMAAQVANMWSKNFIESNLERRFEATSYARKFLEDRLASLQGRLEESERLLVGYAASQRIISVPVAGSSGTSSTERTILADDLSALNTELSMATADRIRAQSRINRNTRSGGNSAEALSNSAITGLRQKRAEVAAEYAKLMSQFEAEYPPAKAVESQLRELDRSLLREERRVGETLQASYAQSVDREQALQSRVDALKNSFIDQRRRSIQYNIYQREVDTNRQLYEGLLQRYKEIGVAGGVGTNNVSVVDAAAVPEKPSSPRLAFNLLLALLAGSIIGIACALGLEQIDEAISDPAQVASALGLPLLGTVPKTFDDDLRNALADRKSPMVEAYISVQTNLEFSTNHGMPRSFMVTSTRPAEGKSTTAYALAHSLARSKKKVVLIDGDMRSPSVHGLFGLKNTFGLSNYLAGNDEITTLPSPSIVSGLDIIVAGQTPPNAAELLTGDRLNILIQHLLKRYDHVVIDSPPVMGLADAPLIASKVEGAIYAIESHGIRSSLVKTALGRLRSANVRIFGAVLTKFDSKRAHYGYGYEYGYGYGGRDAAEET